MAQPMKFTSRQSVKFRVSEFDVVSNHAVHKIRIGHPHQAQGVIGAVVDGRQFTHQPAAVPGGDSFNTAAPQFAIPSGKVLAVIQFHHPACAIAAFV